MTSFLITGLPGATFRDLFSRDDDTLAAMGARRVVADASPGYPCRVSLEDAAEGETLVLSTFHHNPVTGPYRAAGPIYVRENATEHAPTPDRVPASLRTRLLSVRAYDETGNLQAADVVDGAELESAIDAMFRSDDTAYLHVHYARPGCYAARVDRIA